MCNNLIQEARDENSRELACRLPSGLVRKLILLFPRTLGSTKLYSKSLLIQDCYSVASNAVPRNLEAKKAVAPLAGVMDPYLVIPQVSFGEHFSTSAAQGQMWQPRPEEFMVTSEWHLRGLVTNLPEIKGFRIGG